MTLMKRTSDMFPAFFDDFFRRDWPGRDMVTFTQPAVNIIEKDDEYMVELAAPGMKKKDFNVELEEQVLTISYEKKEEKEDKDEEGRFAKREFNYTSFSRSFVLPKSIESEKIKGEYKDGVLKLIIPKKEEAKHKMARHIEIN